MHPIRNAIFALALVPLTPLAAQAGQSSTARLDVREWRVIKRESGPADYYRVVLDPQMPFIEGRYRPPTATTVLGFQLGDDDRKNARALRWQWRAVTLPEKGDECARGREDSAAVVYVTWKKFLRWYTIKYVWSAVGTPGAVCDRKRNPFMAQDTVVLKSGGPLGAWQSEKIDLKSEFQHHFANGDPNADVPDLVGIGLMTDGDQTHSDSAADYADFVLVK
jgi:hypothetical protein